MTGQAALLRHAGHPLRTAGRSLFDALVTSLHEISRHSVTPADYSGWSRYEYRLWIVRSGLAQYIRLLHVLFPSIKNGGGNLL